MSDEKRNSKKRGNFLAPLAGVLLLAAALFGLAALVAFGALGVQSEAGWSFVIGAAVCLLGWFFGRRSAIKQARIAGDEYSRGRAILAVNSVASVLLFLVLMVGANYVAARRRHVFDLTRNRINSLSDQTLKTLGEIKAPLDFIYVWAPTQRQPQPDANVQAVLDAYKNASSKISVEYFNAYQDPFRFRQLRLNTFSGQPILVIAPHGDKGTASTLSASRQEVAVADESNITSALLKINYPKPRALYFLSGHGEWTPPSENAPSSTRINAASAALRAQNYTLQNLYLLGAKSKIPDDAQAVLVLAPQVDITADEVEKLKKYVRGKGRLVLCFEPSDKKFPHWQSVLAALDLEIAPGLIYEFDGRYFLQRPNYVISPLNVKMHPLLRGVNASAVFANASPLKQYRKPPPNPPRIAPLFGTSNKSQQALLQNGKLASGARGPFSIAAALESQNGLRAVVVGDAEFCADEWFNQLGNAAFFLSSVNWVTGNDALVSIPPKPPVTNTITLDDATQRFAVLFALVVMPVLALFVGTVTWWKRR